MQVIKNVFQPHGDDRGQLVSLEEFKNIPFRIKRVYYMYDTKKGVVRGAHAHKSLQQILVCIHGSCKIRLDDGKEKKVIQLEKPYEGLYVALIYICFLGQESTVQNLLIAPVEILGIQSIFNSLFGVTHNGGTWFVSCILMCYLVYPLIQEIIKQLTSKLKVTIILIAVFILLYSPLIVHFFKTSGIYSNPFFRIMEFLIGTIICSLIPSIQGSKLSKIIFSWWVILIEHAVLIICITEAVKHNIAVGNYMLYSWVALPMFMVIIISMYGAKSPRNMVNSKIVNYLCEISYAFFLCQFFSWKITMFIISKIGMDNNLLRIGISFMVCMGYTVLLHEALEKPISNYLKKKLL